VAVEGEALREVFVRFSAEVEGEDKLEHVSESADKAKEHVQEAGEHAEHAEGLFHSLGEALEGVAAVFAGSELLHGIRETTESLERLSHLSEQTGIATESLQFYGFVVEQAGGSAEEFNGQLSALQRSLSRTDSAVSPQTDALKKLGIETQNASGDARDMNEVLPEIFENFEKLKNPQEEAAVATRLFGKSGLALLPVLREGAKGFEEYRAQFEATGGATPQESIERAKEYEKSLKRLTATFNDLKTHLVTGVLPALTHATEWITGFTSSMSKFLKGTTAGEHAVFALAAAVAGPLMAALGPLILPGLKFAGIFLAVDEVLGFLEGKDSLIGRAIDGLFGDGSQNKVREWITNFLKELKELHESSGGIFEAIADGLTVALADMGIAVDEFFLNWYKKWNDLVGATGGKLGLNIDTKAAEDELASLKKVKDDIAKDAYEKLHPEESAAQREKEANEKRSNAEAAAHGGGAPQTQAQMDAFAAQIRNDPQALFRALKEQARERNGGQFGPPTAPAKAPGEQFGAPTLGESTNTAGVLAEIRANNRQKAADAEVQNLALAPIPGANGTFFRGEVGTGTRAPVVNDNKVINIHVDSKAGEDLKRTVKQAVAEALKDDSRSTMQAITQRGSK
jgi:hypothetical protein